MARLGEAFSYEDLAFQETMFEGIPIRVATPKTLYQMKKDTLRLQDHADAESLKRRFGLED